mgnify:FL=1
MKVEWTKSMTKRVLVYIVAGIGILAAYFILINLKRVSGILSSVSDILRPFIIAAIFAYIVNGPMMFFERLFGRLTDKKKPRPVLKRVLAIIAAWVASLAVLVLFFVIIVPDVKISITTLINNLPSYFESLKAFIVALAEKYQLDISYLNSFMNFQVTADGIMEIIDKYSDALIPQLANIANISVQIGSFIADVIIAIIISVYLLFSKETLIAQLKKVLYALFNRKLADVSVRVARETHRTFSGFINGKLLDSLIIGILCFIGMSILKFEYALLISFIVGVTNVIPFFGPMFGAVPSVLLLLMIDPWHALWFAVFIFALQQLDGNVIGPKILGDSTGLPALWVMFAILVGGALWGVAGMFVGVPLFAVIYRFSKEIFENLLKKKNMPENTNAYKVIKGVKDKADIESEAEK